MKQLFGEYSTINKTLTSENAGQIVRNIVNKISETYSGTNQMFIYSGVIAFTFIYMYIIYFISTALDVFLLGAFGYFTAIILRMHIKLSAMCKIAVHSLTLPIILNAIYVLIKTFTGFEIKYFDIMYIAISYIYIITAILMIKSDFIKNEKELTRILQEQEKIRQELERQKQEEKEKQDKEEQKRKDKEKEEEDNEKELDDKEPQGDNA